MIRTLMTKFFVFILLASLLGLVPHPASATAEGIILKQSPQALIADQRLVGNVSAQAKREGVIVDVPQLFIYYGDTSPAYHLAGFRPTLARELDIVVNARRMERSMVALSRLLERAEQLDGSVVSVDDLPEADLYIVQYERLGCEACAQVQQAIESWLANRSDTAFGITISLDR